VKLPKQSFWPAITLGLSFGWVLSLSTGQWAFMGTGIAMVIMIGIALAPNRTKSEKEDQPPGPTK
jgi:hypothetical protein